MTSPKTFKRYPAQWLDLFYQFQDNPDKVIEVACPSQKHAYAMRLEFYKVRTVFLRENAGSELERVLNEREVKVKDNIVSFDLKSNSWISCAINSALAEDGKEKSDE